MSAKKNLKHDPTEAGHSCVNCDLHAFIRSIAEKYGTDLGTVNYQMFIHTGAAIAKNAGPDTLNDLVDGIMSIDSQRATTTRSSGVN